MLAAQAYSMESHEPRPSARVCAASGLVRSDWLCALTTGCAEQRMRAEAALLISDENDAKSIHVVSSSDYSIIVDYE